MSGVQYQYDRVDAALHYIFKQTQGDAWFRPNEENSPCGVAVRVEETGAFRVFPYENPGLEPFATAVAALNPAAAVKVRSAAVHATLAEIALDDSHIYVDANTRIQVLDTMMELPHADKEQLAAFVRDERVLIVWSDSFDTIVPVCNDFEQRLIKLLWRSRVRPSQLTASTPPSASASISGHSIPNAAQSPLSMRSSAGFGLDLPPAPADPEKAEEPKFKRNWYGRKVPITVDPLSAQHRPVMLYAPVYSGVAAGLSLFFIANGVAILLTEWRLDGSFLRFALCATLPLLFCISLFFTMQIIQNITMAIGPVAHFHENSKYYSAVRPAPNPELDRRLPHITIQMPVYKEGLEGVLAPSVESLKKAMKTYARQGGTSTIFVNDDGLQLLSPDQRAARMAFYSNHGVGWVARPPHSADADGFKRAGRFKKASNMNYAMSLSLKVEKHLETLLAQEKSGTRSPEGEEEMELEDKALLLAIEETHEAAGKREGFRPWASNGRAIRLGQIILLVDSDTVVPEDCLRDAAREMEECPEVAIIQHESDVMQVAHHYFENGVAYFTRRINRCISMACANGEVAPFVGHNAFLRWKAIQDAAFIDKADGQEKIWSESNVSEDFDMALRLQLKGYIIRWSTYSHGEFKEGVSLTVEDELNRWQKYSYGCSELLFNPLVQWLTRGPINAQIHRFVWCGSPIHYKLSMLAYMFSYYGISASITIGLINYVLLGFQLPVDGFYMHSFEIWLATTVVFFGSGNVGYTLLQYRLDKKGLFWGLLENLKWTPFFFFFFGGLAIPVSTSILAYLFSCNITWGSTGKEVERSNFFKEVPKTFKRYWYSLLVSIIIIAGMIVLSSSLTPYQWRVDGTAWAVIFPLAVSTACHILFPIVLNPWLMIFSY